MIGILNEVNFCKNDRTNEKSPHKAGSFNMRDGKIR